MLFFCAVLWVSVAAGRIVRLVWPVRRTISRVQRIGLAAGAPAAAVAVWVGDPLPRDVAAVLLAVAGVCEIVTACRTFAARRRRGVRVFRWGKSAPRPGSHLILWVDAVGVAAIAAAMAWRLGDPQPYWPTVAFGALCPAVAQSIRLERDKRQGYLKPPGNFS
ncbi:MAG TPA: hypothetical protein VGI66_05290 [Streptosporangiaceae bacterium]